MKCQVDKVDSGCIVACLFYDTPKKVLSGDWSATCHKFATSSLSWGLVQRVLSSVCLNGPAPIFSLTYG